jgi:hypothetical protein
LLQEAQLFIDAAHDCHNKIRGATSAPVAVAPGVQPSA